MLLVSKMFVTKKQKIVVLGVCHYIANERRYRQEEVLGLFKRFNLLGELWRILEYTFGVRYVLGWDSSRQIQCFRPSSSYPGVTMTTAYSLAHLIKNSWGFVFLFLKKEPVVKIRDLNIYRLYSSTRKKLSKNCKIMRKLCCNLFHPRFAYPFKNFKDGWSCQPAQYRTPHHNR